jgi:hypothetical protein
MVQIETYNENANQLIIYATRDPAKVPNALLGTRYYEGRIELSGNFR